MAWRLTWDGGWMEEVVVVAVALDLLLLVFVFSTCQRILHATSNQCCIGTEAQTLAHPQP